MTYFCMRKARVPAALLVLALAAFHGCTSPEQALEHHLARARALIAEGRMPQAGVELQNAMRVAPKAPEPLFLTGVILEDAGRLDPAFQHYRSATQVDPGYLPALARMGTFLLLGGQFDQAEAIAAKVLAADPAHPDGRALDIAVLSARGRADEALQRAQALLLEYPAQRDAVSLIVGLHQGRRDPAAALAVLERAVAAEPRNAHFRSLYARIARQQGRNDIAEAQYGELVRLFPTSHEHRRTLAVFQSGLDRLDAAEKTLRESIAADVKDEQRVLDLAQFLAERRSPELAQQELAATIRKYPKAFSLRLRMAEGERAAGRTESFEALLNALIVDDTKGASAARARSLLMQEYVSRGRRPEAEALIKAALQRSANDRDALRWRAAFSLRDQRHAEAINDLRTVLRDQGDQADVLEMLAIAYRANGQQELALTLLRDTVARFPLRGDLRLLLARHLTAERQFEEATQVIDAAEKIERSGGDVLLSRFDLQAVQGRWKEAAATADAIKRALPAQPLGYLRLAQALAGNQRTDLALRELGEAVARFPQDRTTLIAFMELATASGQLEVARQRLAGVVAAHPSAALAHVLLGEIDLAAGRVPAAEALFRQALKARPGMGGAFLNLARIEASRGRIPAAMEHLQAGLKAEPGDARLALAMAEAQVATGQPGAAMSTLETLLRADPGNAVAANNLASMLAEGGDPARLARAEQLADRFRSSDVPSFVHTLGWIYFLQGRNAEAIPLLARAVKLQPLAPMMRYHLALALMKSGDVAAARVQLRQAVSAGIPFPGFEEAKRLLSDS